MKSVFLSPLEKASVVAFQVVGGGVALDSCLCKALFSHPYLPPASPLLRVGVILCPLLPPRPAPASGCGRSQESSAFLPQKRSRDCEGEGWQKLGLNRMNAWILWKSCNSFHIDSFLHPFTVHLHATLHAGAEGAGEKQAALLPVF